MRLLIVLAVLFAFPLMAADEFDREITVDGQDLERVGTARLSWLWYDAYSAALWAPEGIYNADKIHAIELHYGMSFSSQELVDESLRQLNKLDDVSAQDLECWKPQLNSLQLEVKKGDRVRMIAQPNRSITFLKNGIQIAQLEEEKLSNHYLQIWLSDGSAYPDVTRSLKGK